MKIYLLDINPKMVDSWKKHFADLTDVEIVCEDFSDFMKNNDIECVVSPANSYGIMDGGYDLAITHYFGVKLMIEVQKHIINNYFGEQPVGSSFILEIPNTNQKLIHTPTMRIPSVIIDPKIVYHCMRSTLICALQNDIKSIVIPAFGGCCGCLEYDDISFLMRKAYDQIKNPPKRINWEHALNDSIEDIY